MNSKSAPATLAVIDLDAEHQAHVGKMTLKAGNLAFYQALTAAITATFHLDDSGCCVLDIDIRGGKPVLRIDRPPAFVRGVPTVVRLRHGIRERRVCANWHGAQIEWLERDRPGDAADLPPCVGEAMRDTVVDIHRTAFQED